LVVSAEAVPAAERAVLLTSLLSAVELLVPEPALGWPLPEPELLALDWVAPAVEPVAPELVPVGLAPAVPDPEWPVRACDAALTVEPTTELAVETGESAEELAGPWGGGGSVAACACRENTSRTTKIPAATIASCTAR
jgi:hypothetical protein